MTESRASNGFHDPTKGLRAHGLVRDYGRFRVVNDAQQTHEQRLLAWRSGRRREVKHLNEFDGVVRSASLDDLKPTWIAAVEFPPCHDPPPGTAKLAVCVVRSSSTL